MPLVQAEHGCIEYAPAVDCPTSIPVQNLLGDNTVVIIEKWSDVAALEAHLKAPHMADYRVKVNPFEKSVTLRVLQPACAFGVHALACSAPSNTLKRGHQTTHGRTSPS